MTAVREPALRTPPRSAVRSFWVLHRAIVRLSGGRIGITRPRTGVRFGMLRLATVGRRSGQARVAMVGYYEDGPNLVTLAMNGWAPVDPAWWLNLQAHPDATVDLPDGSRTVRARAASGEERARLWATFRDYPGWGADIDALAARRSIETAVVVLEPVVDEAREPSGPRATQVVSDGRSIARTFQARRLAWVLAGLAIAVDANVQAAQHHLGLAPLLVFGIAPHLPVVLGLGQPHLRGQLAPRAVPLFNAMHHPAPPLALLALAAMGFLPPFWLVAALAWLGHIVVDLALGDGLRTADGWRR